MLVKIFCEYVPNSFCQRNLMLFSFAYSHYQTRFPKVITVRKDIFLIFESIELCMSTRIAIRLVSHLRFFFCNGKKQAEKGADKV